MKILIVEDQKYPLRGLKSAIGKVVPRFYPGFNPEQDLHVARSFTSAESLIANNAYDLALLDHRMPVNDTGDLEDRDFDAFSDSLQNIGYGLIASIKKGTDTIVIGTSSTSEDELRRFAKPDYRLNKLEAEAELERILKEISARR